ncbi:uncharacterized protein At4g15970-like [Lycium barbarum]|uniref:uncharacterized protein At4g15970-like n=1 Tax=Lycium barbarum TaxID=112863 RepID=UPI00293F5257|nr:uncharacterized protein At4g15970-like [Lycium barbarum]
MLASKEDTYLKREGGYIHTHLYFQEFNSQKRMANLEGGESNINKLGDEEKLLDEAIATTPSNGFHHQPQIISSRNIVKIFLLFSAVALSSLLLYHSSSYPLQFLPNYNYKPVSSLDFNSNYVNKTSSSNSSVAENLLHGYNSTANVSAQAGTLPSKEKNKQQQKSKLEKVLEKAAMGDKTVIITALNAAWTEPNSIFDVFLKSFRVGNQTKPLLKHVVVAALDQTAYTRCLEKQLHCYALTTKGVDFSGEAHFMSEDYLKMMWRRIDFLRNVLEMGYNFIFTDADILWFRQPFAHFYLDTDFQIACDHYWYDSTDLHNSPNGGFNFVKSNQRTIQFYKFWYNAREAHPGKHDQDVLNMIKFNPFIKDIGLKIRFLDTALFGGFCEPSKDLNLVCTMHANCCIGIDNKLHDLTMALDDWEKYMALPGDERVSKPQTWTVPRICG